MALDSRYVLAYHFEQYFVDKDTGVPLEGVVKFFRDTSRLIPKSVYILSGTPPNYTYVDISNEVEIANGVPTYNNNNVALYFFPFLGAPADESTTIDLYFYQTYNSGDVLQFTREAQPNVFSGSGGTIVEENFVPNGQFRLHNDLPATDISPVYDTGEIRANTTDIAPGGWTFEVTDFTQSTDFVTFDQHLPTTPDIAANPRYSVEIVCDDEGNEQTKNLCLRFNDVNKFSSTTQKYTYGFTARSLSGSSLNNVQLNLFKNYGTDGSISTTTPIDSSFNIPISQTKFEFAFVFGDNSAKTIGSTLDDDFLQLQIVLPGVLLEVEFTDFYLAIGDLTNENLDFPPTPDAEFIYKSLIPPVPNYAGFDLYLVRRQTKAGEIYDDSEIGKKEDYTFYKVTDWNADSTHISTNLVLAAGQQYETTGYSALGIPFARLQEKYWDSTNLVPIHGTGLNFMTATIPANDNVLLINNNSEGAVTNASDGTATTGFTFATIHKETATYYMNSVIVNRMPSPDQFFVINKNVGAVTAINAGTSGFTVNVEQFGTVILKEISSVITATIANNPGNPGKYFTLQSINGVPAPVSWYVWYQVSTETDPAPAGTGIKINLAIGDSAVIIAQKTQQALNGWQETTIATVAASSLVAGDYFNIYSHVNPSSDQLYVVWYTKDGTGTQPIVVGSPIYIQVNILSADTANQVATKTQMAMNMKYFAVPDYRGWFLRGWDNGAGNDPEATTRFSFVPGVIGDMVGTFQLTQNKQHKHESETGDAFVTLGGTSQLNQTGDALFNETFNTTAADVDGGPESRPPDKNVNYVIRY